MRKTFSPDPADRTSTITVTTHDGSMQKVYKVLFRYMSTDATLSMLWVRDKMLCPGSDPGTYLYEVCWPWDICSEAPDISYETTEPNAEVQLIPTPPTFCNHPKEEDRTATLTVTAEDGIHQQEYKIIFQVKQTCGCVLSIDPETVYNSDTIRVTSTKNGTLYLVPVDTPPILDSIMENKVISVEVIGGETSLIPATGLDPVNYWIYAVDEYCVISGPAVLTTGLAEIKASLVKLYPIPVDEVLYLATDDPIFSVEVFNTLGIRIMHEYQVNDRIYLGHLEKGIYFIRVKTKQGRTYTDKVVKR